MYETVMNNTSSTAVMEQNSVILVVNEYEKVSHRGHFLWTPTHEKKNHRRSATADLQVGCLVFQFC